MQKPIVTVQEQGPAGDPRSILVLIDRHDGRGPQWSLSAACGWGTWPEARAAAIAEARAQVAEHVAGLVARGAQLAQKES